MRKILIYSLCGMSYLCTQELHTKTTLQSVLYTKTLPNTTTTSLEQSEILTNDIAKSLTYISGFSMTRKGGGGSEVYYRSQGGSRLPILINGGILNGGCGGRMDTTLTYLFSQNYDTLTILKGPQDVRYGALIAGGLLFDRESVRLESNTFRANANMLYGSFNHKDFNASALVGGKYGSLGIIASDYSSNDYKAANAKTIHSAYNRQSVSLIGTLTPTKDTLIELSANVSKGEAAYADRGMDGRSFDRKSFMLKFQQKISPSIPLLDIRAWHNSIDHSMDNFTLRPNSTQNFSINNPKRTANGAKIELTLKPTDILTLYVGSMYNHDEHDLRQVSGLPNAQIANQTLANTPFAPNFRFQNLGMFVQGEVLGDFHYGIFFGMRYDALHTSQFATNTQKLENLFSGFGRYEYYLPHTTFFAGIGVAQRGADFWEKSKINGMNLAPETNTQLDFGVLYYTHNASISVLGFYSQMRDYILLYYGANTSALNTNARMLGGELEARYKFFDMLSVYGSLSYIYAQDLNAHAPLPQIAPLTAQVGMTLQKGGWFVRADMYSNAAQHRYRIDYGNVVGKDLGASAGFYTLNAYGGYTYKKLSFLFGVENLTNTLYAYHLSRNSVAINMLDNPVNTRVYEPGRNFWLKIQAYF
ncbi:MAG: TonB-dependent receptor [Helicobacter sp.]|uniref:TonB-dependent receptor domain-containing protein n=1 Tax=Helicobacter sp. TaxID=218 RepID=UPI002A7E7B50|nr:TonB-dependent receptor [Helicobacter sp.]